MGKKISTKDQVMLELDKKYHDDFLQLYEEYAFHSVVIVGKKFVNAKILAELIKSGWRPPKNKDQ